MLLALALYASTAHAGIPAGFGRMLGVVNENTPHYDLELLYHDGKAHRPDKRLLLRLPPSPRRGAPSPGTSASANLKTGVGAPLGVYAGGRTDSVTMTGPESSTPRCWASSASS